jgi:hypothetical protein
MNASARQPCRRRTSNNKPVASLFILSILRRGKPDCLRGSV